MALPARRLPSLPRVPASPVPRSRRYYEGATTSHPRIYGHSLVRARSPRDPSSFVFAVALPEGRRSLPGLGLCWCRRPHLRLALAWTRMGSLRSSGDPSCAFAPLRDPGRTNVPSPCRSRRCCPRWVDGEGFGEFDFGANTQLRHLLPYASRGHCCPRARLASGWMATLYRVGVEPTGSLREVSARVDGHSPLLLS